MLKAQPGNLQLGIEGGPNTSAISSQTMSYFGNYCLGISGQYHFKDFCIVKTGIDYEEKGYLDPFAFSIYNPGFYPGEGQINMDYIVLPLTVKVTYTRKAYIFGEAGAYIAYLLKANESISFNDDSNKVTTFKFNTIRTYQRFDAGACMGVGGGIKLWDRLVIELEAKLNIGLATVDFNDPGHPENQSASLILGIRYSIQDKK